MTTFPSDPEGADTTERLAQSVAAPVGASIPKPTLTCIEEWFLDLVGNTAYVGCFAESSMAFRAGAGVYAGGAISTVVGETTKYSPAQAALLNGAFAHTLYSDDTNVFSALHRGPCMIAAAIVQAEHGVSSGPELVAALALGYRSHLPHRRRSGLDCLRSGVSSHSDRRHLRRGRRYGAPSGGRCGSDRHRPGSLACGSMQYLDSGA